MHRTRQVVVHPRRIQDHHREEETRHFLFGGREEEGAREEEEEDEEEGGGYGRKSSSHMRPPSMTGGAGGRYGGETSISRGQAWSARERGIRCFLGMSGVDRSSSYRVQRKVKL